VLLGTPPEHASNAAEGQSLGCHKNHVSHVLNMLDQPLTIPTVSFAPAEVAGHTKALSHAEPPSHPAKPPSHAEHPAMLGSKSVCQLLVRWVFLVCRMRVDLQDVCTVSGTQ